MQIDFSKKSVQWTTLGFLALIWGSSFILMKRGLQAFAAEEVAAYRIFIVFVCLSPFALKKLYLHRAKIGWAFFGVGFFGSALPYFLFVKAQTYLSSSLTGILNSLTPVFTLLFAALFFKQRFQLKSIIGIIFGFFGAVGLIYFNNQSIDLTTFSAFAILPIIGSASYGVNVNLIKMYLQQIDPLAVTSLSFIIVGPLAGLYLFTATDFTTHLLQHPDGWASFAYINMLGIVGTAFAVWIFNLLIKETSALLASSVTYLIPLVAIAWGLLDGETLNFYQLASALVILGAISLINAKRKA